MLAAYGAPGFWVMTGALLALGACHLLTAWGLRAAGTAGRVGLGAGGVSAWAVVLLPAPSSGGSVRHGAVAVVAFVLLAGWPVLAVEGGGAAPWCLRPASCVVVTVFIGVGGAWFLVEMHRQGVVGAAERVVAAVQLVWSFVVAVSCLHGSRGRGRRAVGQEAGGG